MLDAHCHIDLYPEPSRIAQQAEEAGVFTVLVTNLPSAFEAALPHVREFRKIRLALGLHPLCPEAHEEAQLQRFKDMVDHTSFIGEVGLDFSSHAVLPREVQLNSLRFALRSLRQQKKFVTVHSRRAESQLLDLIREGYSHPVVFHWFTGSRSQLDAAIAQGHFFSVNPAMIRSKSGIALIERMPPTNVLTESDGPFIEVDGRQIVPADVYRVEKFLGGAWGLESVTVRSMIAKNFRELLPKAAQGTLRPQARRNT
jgi:TatD DNase family protein